MSKTTENLFKKQWYCMKIQKLYRKSNGVSASSEGSRWTGKNINKNSHRFKRKRSSKYYKNWKKKRWK